MANPLPPGATACYGRDMDSQVMVQTLTCFTLALDEEVLKGGILQIGI